MARKPVLPPGTNVGRDAGIFQEIGGRGGLKDNFSTVSENKRLPPTSESGNGWVRVDRTPHGHRR